MKIKEKNHSNFEPQKVKISEEDSSNNEPQKEEKVT